MNMGWSVFFSVIVILAIVAVCAFVVYLEREFPSKKYDERQKIARGKAFRFSHWIGMFYYFALMVAFIFHTGKGEWFIQPFVWIFIGILIQLQAFHIYCLMTHCALPLGTKPMPTIIGYVLLGGIYFAQFWFQYIPENTVGLVGAASFNLFRLLLAVSFFSLAVLHLIAYLRKEKE